MSDSERSRGVSALLGEDAAAPLRASHARVSAAARGRPAEDDLDTLRQILEALPAAVYTTDAEGRLTFFNEAAVDMAGRRPVLGSDRWCVSWRLFRPDGTPLPLDECPMALALKHGRPIRGVEAVLERPDGSRMHFLPYPTPLFDAAGRLVGGVNMLVDISDRKRAEEALRRLNELLARRVDEQSRQADAAATQMHEAEQRFRILVQGVTDYAIFMLDPEGVITNWNTGAQRIKGYAAEEVVGRHFSMFYTEADRRIGKPQTTLATARQAGRFESEGWRVRKDGSTFWAGVVVDAIRDESGRFVGFAKVTRDLTERRAAEEQLRQAQKMEAIGQLTGGVAHDFNNILTAIIGNLEMLVGELPAGPPRRHADTALRAALRGARLTDQLLAYARRQEIRPEIVNVADLLQETIVLVQKTVGEGIEVELRASPDLWTCHVDAAQLEATVLNLASNARDAMERFGRLVIAAENASLPPGNRAALAAGDYVVLSIADSGCGMSEEVLARAFEPFYTTKEVGKGTGLGLSQVYGFARQSGGGALIESREGAGTTVRVYLPRVDGEPEAAAPAARPERVGEPAKPATILVVEDDADVRDTIAQMLTRLGYRIRLAKDSDEALRLLRRDRSIDLLFTDLVMPGKSGGLDLARAARSLRPELKILTGSASRGETVDGPDAEFAFTAKPHRSASLAEKLEQLLQDLPGRRD